jgi:hypothetical protein
MLNKTVAWATRLAGLLGASSGIFWIFAIDAARNGASWAPNFHHWIAYVTCPFIPLVGLNTAANVCVPIFNGATFGLVGLSILKILRVRRSHA